MRSQPLLPNLQGLYYSHHPEDGFLQIGSTKHYTEEEHKQLAEHLLTVLPPLGVKALLLDAQSLKSHRAEFSDWLNNTYLPRLQSVGIAYMAHVFPEDAFGQFEIRRWHNAAQLLGIKSGIFHTQEHARLWLRAVLKEGADGAN